MRHRANSICSFVNTRETMTNADIQLIKKIQGMVCKACKEIYEIWATALPQEHSSQWLPHISAPTWPLRSPRPTWDRHIIAPHSQHIARVTFSKSWQCLMQLVPNFQWLKLMLFVCLFIYFCLNKQTKSTIYGPGLQVLSFSLFSS